MIQPIDLGAPPRLGEWRPLQVTSLNRLLASGKRFDAAALPTGTGKSLLGYGFGKLLAGRGIYATSTKGLMDQYSRDHDDLHDIRGMSNYPCRALGNIVKCDSGPCLDGEACVYKEEGCDYFDAIKRAREGQQTLTNYVFWLSGDENRLGSYDYMVADEAHELPALVARAAGAEFSAIEVEIPRHESMEDWIGWAGEKLTAVHRLLEVPGATPSQRRDLRSLASRFKRVAEADPGLWAWEPAERGRGIRFEPLLPSQYAEMLLWRGIPKILLMSATLRPTTLTELGIPSSSYNFFESESPIPIANRPIYWMPIGTRINASTSQTNLEYWVSRQDQVIKPRLHARGIIHTVSYARARFLREHSRYSEHMLLHTGESTRRVVEQFKKARPPAILVSPVMHTGWDFPEDAARWQILAKVPMPDTRAGIAAARVKLDPEWPVRHAIQTIVQITGRVARGAQDVGETVIIDDTMRWLWSRYKPHFPSWWRQAFREVDSVPPPRF